MSTNRSILKLLWLALPVLLLAEACKKDDAPAQPIPAISLSVTADTVRLVNHDSIVIKAIVENNVVVKHSWRINDALQSTSDSIKYVANNEGYYLLQYSGGNEQGMVEKQLIIAILPKLRPIGDNSSRFISKIFDFLPAPGQFVNEGIATIGAAEKLIGGTNSLLHLGAYGGYVVFGFDHSIKNAEGMDLAIYGNPLAPPLEWSEPGIVMVSMDRNNNGLPDDPWFELASSEYNQPETKKNYQVTYYNPKDTQDVPWKDNLGNTGAVEINRYHNHQYYPLFAPNQDSITFRGTCLKNTFGMVGSIYVNTGFNWGYADNYSAGDNYKEKGYNSFNIDWAVDASGRKVSLPAIDFVKVYTGQNDKGNTVLGEVSCEIRGAADLHMK
jgi:hypothetical protein